MRSASMGRALSGFAGGCSPHRRVRPWNAAAGCIASCCLALAALAGGAAPAAASDAEQAALERRMRVLVTRAAAIPKRELARWNGSSLEEASGLDNEPLTLLILMLPATAEATQGYLHDDFRFARPMPKPADLMTALEVPSAPDMLSVIQSRYITALGVSPEGYDAMGEIEIRAPGCYIGQIPFRAIRVGGDWQIVEFALPSWEVRTILDGNGRWRIERFVPPEE